MSRHRFLQAFEKEAYEELNAEDNEDTFENDPAFQEKLEKAFVSVKELIGVGFDDAEIEETLFYYNLNVTKSVQWLLEGIDVDAKPKSTSKSQTSKKNIPPAVSAANFDDKVAAGRANLKKGTFVSESKPSKPPTKSTEKGKPPTSQEKELSGKKSKDASTAKMTDKLSQLKLDQDPPSWPKEMKKSHKELQKAYQSRRAHLNLVMVGHVDAGKSTLLGHFLHLTGNVDKKVMHKYTKQAAEYGKSSFEYAWVLDANEDERQRGVTMSLGYTTFETPTKVYSFMDAPGHQDWVPQMIAGACMADVACLVLDASPGAFESGLERGQTKEHGLLLKAMAVTHVIVLVNKMDRVNWDIQRYQEMEEQIRHFLAQLNYSNATVIPVSGLRGENLTTRTDSAPWYQGPCFLEILDQLEAPERSLWQPFRLRISETKGTVVRGQIDAGSIQIGDSVMVLPHRATAHVRSILVEGSSSTFAVAGDAVDLHLASVDADLLFKHAVLCSPSSPIPVTNIIECKVVIFDCKIPITPGFQFLFHQGSLNEPGHVKRLLGLLDKSTGEIIKKNPRCVTKGSKVLMEIELDRSICLEHHEKSKQFGRFSLRAAGETVGAGIVTKIIEAILAETVSA